MNEETPVEKALARVLELVGSDKELHDAVVELIQSFSTTQAAKAEWYARRNRDG